MRCPHCKQELKEAFILSANGTICARRRARLKHDKAVEMNALSQEAKRKKKK